jgi:hypothetical protein
MRQNLEEILAMQKDVEKRIVNFLDDEQVEDYRVYWLGLKKQYNENNKNLANYMVRKCNR